ncbi:E3 ubiquitin-protein ligase AIRP2-like isoform X2 [Wolffia australiana]
MFLVSMRKSFKDSVKVLEADIQHANTLASEFPGDYDGACLQMRMSYSPAARLFLFLVQWTDCHLAGTLGLLRVLIYKVYVDGTTTMSTHERKATIREFYAVIFPSLLQLQEGITDVEDRQQRALCIERYRRRDEGDSSRSSEINPDGLNEEEEKEEEDEEEEEECEICMEVNGRIVLPNCGHGLCLKCYRDWRARSQSCPFCRDSLKRVNSGDLWVYTVSKEVVDPAVVRREDARRLFFFVDNLPLVFPNADFTVYDPQRKWREN